MTLEAVAEALNQVSRDDAGVVSAYGFGSVARGATHRESDVDGAVLLDWKPYPTARERFEARLRLSTRLAAALHRNDVDLLVLNDAPPHLSREVVTRGIRALCSDVIADRAFTRTAMLRAADLDPFLQRARRVKLAALER